MFLFCFVFYFQRLFVVVIVLLNLSLINNGTVSEIEITTITLNMKFNVIHVYCFRWKFVRSAFHSTMSHLIIMCMSKFKIHVDEISSYHAIFHFTNGYIHEMKNIIIFHELNWFHPFFITKSINIRICCW